MLSQLNIYRPILYRFILGFYMLGVFQAPLLEGVHLLSHLIQAQGHDVQFHLYLQHTSDHKHTLIASNDDDDTQNDKNDPIKVQEPETKIQIAVDNQEASIIDFEVYSQTFIYTINHLSEYLFNITPPPKRS